MRTSALAILLVLFSAVDVSAQQQDAAQTSVPRLVQFNSLLRDSTARPVSGIASVTFAIYAEQDGGAALWSETQNVLADSSGHFNVVLGAATAAFGAGLSRTVLQSYLPAFFAAGALCIFASLITLAIARHQKPAMASG